MSWEKIENHLFDKYDVEGEDKELSNLMEEHDKEVRAKAIDEFAYKCKEHLLCRTFGLHPNNIDEIAEQMKAGGKNE